MTTPDQTAPTLDHDWVMAQAAQMQARGETAPRAALDAVNPAMIRHWAEAMGDTDPRWQGAEPLAPPAMAQVWTMYGLDPHRPADDPLHGTMQALDKAGFTSVLGTNCDQTYSRPLRVGERPEISTQLTSVVGPKRTGVGEGYFVTTESIWRVAGEEVATMTFRVLKFKPGTGRPSVDRTKTVRPVINRDNAFFFEGTKVGEVRIQKCNACGELRHPPGPVCPSCHAMDRGWIVASGRGVIHSYVVHHAPSLPGKRLPLPLAVVELEEGVRLVGAVQGVTEDSPLAIGTRVRAVFDRIDADLTLIAFAQESQLPAEESQIPAEESQISAEGSQIPAWTLPITPTLVVSTALATRDFQDVHHDRDLAVTRGSKDIFLNILTTTGLAQKYVGDWAREQGWPDFQITACALRLGAPAYPYDSLTFTGDIVEEDGDTLVIDVTGKVSLGDHVTARITLEKA